MKTLCLSILTLSVGWAQLGWAEGKPSPNGEYVLTDFGDISKPDAIQKTFDAACDLIKAKGGGVLIIPPSVPQDVTLYNRTQDKRESGPVTSPVVTVIDRRAGYNRILVPPVGRWSTTAWHGQEINRTMNFQGPGIGHWGSFYGTSMRNNLIHGTSSYLHPTAAAASKGKDRRVYVHTIRGIFVGQYLTYYAASGTEAITVKSIGWDKEKNKPYFTADLTMDHPAGVMLSNKNVVGSLSIDSSLNADQQTSGELSVIRRQYAHGDCFVYNGMYIYQGDVLTQMGDEGGMVFNAEITQDPNPFHSKVESVKLEKDEIKFVPGVSNPEKLAGSRPLINMNPKKWITAGTVKIVAPDNWSGMLIQDPSFDVAAAVKNGIEMKNFKMTREPKEGEDFAVKGWGGNAQYENLYKGRKVIPTVLNWDGNPILKFKNIYQGRAYPSLHNKGYNYLGGRIIASADCGWTPEIVGRYFALSDDGESLFPGDKTEGCAYPVGGPDRKIYRWYMITEFWKNPDGTCGIRLGRVRMFAAGAGAPNLYNEDNYTWDDHERPLRYIIAPGAMVYDVSDGWKDAYGGVTTAADPRIIRAGANSDRGTKMDFEPGDPIEQAIGADPAIPHVLRVRLWNSVPDNMVDNNAAISIGNNGRVSQYAAFALHGAQALEDLQNRKDRKPPFIVGLIVNSTTKYGVHFAADVTDAALMFTQPHGHAQPIKWMHDRGESTLVVDPKSGDMKIQGSDLEVAAVKGAQGISATEVRAKNLRGIDVTVAKGAKEMTVKFDQAETDAKYSISVAPNWMTAFAVTEKTAKGFKVAFAEAAGGNAHLDWQLIR